VKGVTSAGRSGVRGSKGFDHTLLLCFSVLHGRFERISLLWVAFLLKSIKGARVVYSSGYLNYQ
jgi:hypothetical protein